LDVIGVVLVREQKGILRDIVRDILEAHASVEVVGEVTDPRTVVATVERTHAQAVVWLDPVRTARFESATELLRSHPNFRFLTVHGDARHLLTTRYGEASPRGLIEALTEQ